MMRTHKWRYCRSGETIKYSVDYTERALPFTITNPRRKCRGFVSFVIEVEGRLARNELPGTALSIPCIACKDREVRDKYYHTLPEQAFSTEELWEEIYYKFYETRATSALKSHYPDISIADASKITETFIEILRIGNATHRCPEYEPGVGFSTLHTFWVKIEPCPRWRRMTSRPPPDFDIILENEREEGVVEPLVTPATTASVLELLRASKSRRVEEDQRFGGECGVCMDDMKTATGNKLIKMPCSHLFHCACLLTWLNKKPSCPICRYQMPAAQRQTYSQMFAAQRQSH